MEAPPTQYKYKALSLWELKMIYLHIYILGHSMKFMTEKRAIIEELWMKPSWN